jgi:hypothetical protein
MGKGNGLVSAFEVHSAFDIVADALERVLPPAEQDDERIEAGWAALMELVEKFQMDTGIADLAHEHDHYLYGTPKRGMGEEALLSPLSN